MHLLPNRYIEKKSKIVAINDKLLQQIKFVALAVDFDESRIV